MNEIIIRQKTERIFEAVDNGAIIARLEIDEEGREKNLWIHEGYESYKSYIEKAMREKALGATL